MPVSIGKHIPRGIVCIGKGRAVGVGCTRQTVQGIIHVLDRHLGLSRAAQQGNCICFTRWQGVGVLHPAPELRTIQIRPEAVVTLRQGKGHLSAFICRPAVPSIGIAIKDIHAQTRIGIGFLPS